MKRQESPPQETDHAGFQERRQSYTSPLVDHLRSNQHTLTVGGLTLLTAKRFGFCWGVDKAVQIVREAMATHPGRQIWLLNQMIHNPAVNQDLLDRGVRFIQGSYAVGNGFSDVRREDVAIIPAFSARVSEIEALKEIGCIIIDTTCPWVLKPHLRTKRNIEAGFTTVIHATLGHDETRATCSLIDHHGGKYVVVRNLAQAQLVSNVILEKINPLELLEKLQEAVSRGFDPEVDLRHVALINQTTMLASESRSIGRLLEATMRRRYGDVHLREHFRDFDTICNATQDNQDAMLELVEMGNLDLVLVVGGFESSNTKNLARIARQHVPTYHIEDATCLKRGTIRHLPVDQYVAKTDSNWLPRKPELRVGFTAGASTPDSKLAEVMILIGSLVGEIVPEVV